jgi:hypothetical protein
MHKKDSSLFSARFSIHLRKDKRTMTFTPLEPRGTLAQTPTHDALRDDTRKNRTPKRSLSFGKIEVREYERIITDDDPFVSLGLALGWGYRDSDAIPVHEREEERASDTDVAHAFDSQRLSTSQRLKIFKNFGYSNKEIIQAERSRVSGLEYVSSCPCIPLMILKRNVKNMCKLSSKKEVSA